MAARCFLIWPLFPLLLPLPFPSLSTGSLLCSTDSTKDVWYILWLLLGQVAWNFGWEEMAHQGHFLGNCCWSTRCLISVSACLESYTLLVVGCVSGSSVSLYHRSRYDSCNDTTFEVSTLLAAWPWLDPHSSRRSREWADASPHFPSSQKTRAYIQVYNCWSTR